MPGVKFVNPVVELVGFFALQVEIAAGLPAQVRIRVLVSEAHRAAPARERSQEKDKNPPENSYQKLSTVM